MAFFTKKRAVVVLAVGTLVAAEALKSSLDDFSKLLKKEEVIVQKNISTSNSEATKNKITREDDLQKMFEKIQYNKLKFYKVYKNDYNVLRSQLRLFNKLTKEEKGLMPGFFIGSEKIRKERIKYFKLLKSLHSEDLIYLRKSIEELINEVRDDVSLLKKCYGNKPPKQLLWSFEGFFGGVDGLDTLLDLLDILNERYEKVLAQIREEIGAKIFDSL